VREFPKAWAESGTALLAAGAASLESDVVDPTLPAVTLVDLIDQRARRIVEQADNRPVHPLALHWTRYWSVLAAGAAGWATLAIAYCPWHLLPQTPSELGVVLFGAFAGASGALAMILHPEEKP